MKHKPRSFPRWLAVAAVAVGVAGGSYGVAVAASGSSSSGSSGSAVAPSSTVPGPATFPAHGSAAHEDAEKPVAGEAAAKARSAAVTAAGGGTAGEVTTDYSGNGYEVTVTKSDGSTVEIHLDSSFSALQGHGGPCGPGAAPPITGSTA